MRDKTDEAEQFEKTLRSKNDAVRKSCPVLMSGIETDAIPYYGWIEPVEDACLKIEALNKIIAGAGLKVVLQQSKEKFGTLRMYFDVVYEQPSAARRWAAAVFKRAAAVLGDRGLFLWDAAAAIEGGHGGSGQYSDMSVVCQAVQGFIDRADERCQRRCMWCGAVEKRGEDFGWTSGWIRKLCPKCAAGSEK